MTLKDWLDQRERKAPWLARRLNIGAWTARRILSGARLPDVPTMRAIAALTRGEVTANDFYGIASVSEREAV